MRLPVAVGFGISTVAQVRQVWRFADAAVIGSAIVREIERFGNSPGLVKRVGEFAKSLVGSKQTHFYVVNYVKKAETVLHDNFADGKNLFRIRFAR